MIEPKDEVGEYTGIFYHNEDKEPEMMHKIDKVEFIHLCTLFPTDWAYLIKFETGEIVDEYKKNVNKNIE